jgi:hypothetical protein
MSRTYAVAALAAVVVLLPAATASAALYGHSFLYAGNFDDAQVQRLSVTPDGTLGVSTSYAAGLETTSLIIAPDAGALFAGSIGAARIDS